MHFEFRYNQSAVSSKYVQNIEVVQPIHCQLPREELIDFNTIYIINKKRISFRIIFQFESKLSIIDVFDWKY